MSFSAFWQAQPEITDRSLNIYFNNDMTVQNITMSTEYNLTFTNFH